MIFNKYNSVELDFELELEIDLSTFKIILTQNNTSNIFSSQKDKKEVLHLLLASFAEK